MVRELTRERTEDFQTACAYERVFGSEILTLLRVYGLEDDQVRFYLEEQEGRPAAAIALQDRALWVSVRPGTGVEDLAVLAQSIDGPEGHRYGCSAAGGDHPAGAEENGEVT